MNGWTTTSDRVKRLKIPNQRVPSYTAEERRRLQKAFGYSYEEVKTSILNMAKNGRKERLLWVSIHRLRYYQNHQNLFGYFKQLLHRLPTLPSMRSVRKVVTSTTVYIGEDGNLLEEKSREL